MPAAVVKTASAGIPSQPPHGTSTFGLGVDVQPETSAWRRMQADDDGAALATPERIDLLEIALAKGVERERAMEYEGKRTQQMVAALQSEIMRNEDQIER